MRHRSGRLCGCPSGSVCDFSYYGADEGAAIIAASQWPNCIVLEAQSSFSILGQWPQFEARLREDLKELGFRHRIALAPTPGAARVLAGVQDGLAIEQSEHLRVTLGRVPVVRAHLPEDAGERLYKMGLRHMRQVFDLPRDALRRRFGAELLLHVDRLLGQAPESHTCYQPLDVFDMRVELNYEVEQHPALLFPIRRMTADLAAYLAGCDGGVQQFVFELQHEQHAATRLVVGLLSAERAWLAVELHRDQDDAKRLNALLAAAKELGLPAVAAGDVHMDIRRRRALQDNRRWRREFDRNAAL
ncbi:hypothetical protein M2650_01830 [Luteimonas sp. SX5]|uniref:DNA polymerase Y family protein n=1 Tax=Luteimonas galliterrae TaxID=2940486 RepID=A0ABT0MES8_9GAMM|nr:DNA polymerase Y family protein [Luteimonas galliterrae]MCL1633387.1 hypothetical protein [Luteimonas galliterrae]